jgi:hypothetical protein
MGQPTYLNVITESEVSLGIERLFIAGGGTSFGNARVNPQVPPAGFVDLGAVEEDSAKLSVTRKKFKIEAGSPRQVVFVAVDGIEGKFSIKLHSNHWTKFVFASGAGAVVVGTGAKAAMGTSLLPELALLGVADFIDGSQVIHYLPACINDDEVKEEIKSSQNERIELNFVSYGYQSFDYGGQAEWVVCERYYFPPL